MLLQHVTTSTILILPIITLFSISRAVNGLCTPANCSACVMEYTPPFTVVYDASKARLDLSGQTFTMTSSDPSIISNSISKYFILQGGVLKVNNASALIRNEIALNVFGDTILPVIYHFSVFTLSPIPASFSASICVQGLDNNVPTFPRSDVHISVLEGTILSWPMDLAADNDEGENSTQSYSILSNDPSVYSDLYLDIARNKNNMITSMLLNSTAPLDPGRKASYNFTIVAQEGRPNTTKGYQNVYITVLYFCYQPPIFEMPLYQLYLPLRTPINTSLIVVKAVHVSSEIRAPISYSIARVCTTAPFTQCINYPVNSGPFALNNTSGNLILTNTVEYSQARQFNITVVGIDACNFVGSTLILVQITVRPLGIQVALSNKGVIREDYTLTSDIATVIVSNPDNLNINVTVLDSLTGLISNTFYLVNIGSSYQLRLLHSLDSRVKNLYCITIQASDPVYSIASFTFNITVMEVNHPPVFGNKTAFVHIPYNIKNGTIILRVLALDNDVGGNGVVMYELPSSNETYPYQANFTVNPISGDILVNAILDCKVSKNFLLLVKARNEPTDGEPSFDDYLVVNITLFVMDVNRSIQPQKSEPIFTCSTTTGIGLFQVISPTQALQSISAAQVPQSVSIFLGLQSSQLIQSVSPTQILHINSPTPDFVTIIIIAVILAASIILVVCMILVITTFCFLRKKKSKVTMTNNRCEQLQLQHLDCYDQSKADVQCNDIQFVSSDLDTNGLQYPTNKQLSGTDKVQSIRSTSDLASTISTGMITDDTEDVGPYSKSQLMAIYAANANLLLNTGSQNSIHMFGSEGGVEVDEVDVNNLSFDDDDQDSNSIQMDDVLTTSVTNNKKKESNNMSYQQNYNRVPIKPMATISLDSMDDLMKQQHASLPMLTRQQQWEQQYYTHSLQDEMCHWNIELNTQHRYYKKGYRGEYEGIAGNVLPCYQPTRKSPTLVFNNACTMPHNYNQAHTTTSFMPNQCYSVGTTKRPPSSIGPHTYVRSATSHSLTDNSTLSSIRTNQAPEHYYSNFSLGSNTLSQPVP